jgi:hypothetical protein
MIVEDDKTIAEIDWLALWASQKEGGSCEEEKEDEYDYEIHSGGEESEADQDDEEEPEVDVLG